MDILDEVNDLLKQKQVQKLDNRKLTYDEQNKIVCNRLQRINAELFMLFHELAQGKPQQKVNDIDRILRDFQLTHVQELHEQLKSVF